MPPISRQSAPARRSATASASSRCAPPIESIATERDRLAHALFDTTAPTVEEVIEILSADWRPARPDEQRLRRLLGRK